MLAKRLIPSLLLRGDRLVKGVRFADYRDAGSPVTTVRALSAQGADEIAILDIDASRARRSLDDAMVRRVAAEKTVPLLVGGGISTMDHALACMDAGADKLSVNAGALDNPGLLADLAQRFGSQAIVISIDFIEQGAQLLVYDYRRHTVTDRQLAPWVREAVDRGAGEVRLMSVDREGTREGLAMAVLAQVRAQENVPIVIEGGVGTYQHIADAYAAGADGVGVGTFLTFSDNNIVKVKRSVAALGQAMRID